MPEFFTSIAPLLDGSFLQRGSLWALGNIPGFPPIIQTVHILGIAVVMGSAFLLNLRQLGVAATRQPLAEMSSRVLPWLWWALPVMFVSGAFFVFGRPNRYFNNPVFAFKLACLLPVLGLTLFYHLKHRAQPDYWERPDKKWPLRAMALLSLLLWLGVAAGGRWIAYLEYIEYPLWFFETFDAGPQDSIWLAMENWPLSQIIAASNWFPLIETIHVVAAALVVGSVLWVDLRLLGFAATTYPISQLNRDLIPWTWGAFAVAAITGFGMFITRASSHLDNPAFRWKAVLLILAGANMAWFHFKTAQTMSRTQPQWQETMPTPAALKVTGALSLLLWAGVMLAGRWIGHIV